MTKHTSQGQLLRYLDGELSKYSMWKTARHLQACWTCQVEFGRLKDHIATILDAQATVFGPSLPPPPKSWPALGPRLEKTETHKTPLWKRLFAFTGASRVVRLAYGGAALALAITGFLVWVSVTPVSGKEALRRIVVSDTARMAITEHQVVRQKVRVRKTVTAISSVGSGQLESWKSTRSAYWKSAGDPVIEDLRERYKSNGLASALPLSPPTVESWAKIAGGEPRATANGDSVALQIVSDAQGRARGLEEVNLQVARKDWHLNEMTLSFADATYEITEEESTILAQNEVPKDVLAILEPESRVPGLATVPARVPSAPAADANDLEMAVRYDLHQIDADLGESVEISALPNGQLSVEVGGASPDIRERVINLLANRPGIQLQSRTSGLTDVGRGATRTIPPASVARAPDPRLAALLGGVDAQESYTHSVLEASSNILAHLYALRNLANRWPPQKARDLSVNAKIQLRAMVRDHTQEVSVLTSSIQNQIELLWKPLSSGSETGVPAQTGREWQNASALGLDAALRLDRVLRSLLTTSDAHLSLDEAAPQLREGLQDLRRGVQELRSVTE